MRHFIFKSAILLFLFILIESASAQENLIYEKIQEKKTENISFKTISSVFSQEKEDQNLLGQFINPDEVYFFQYNQSSMKDLSNALLLTVPLRNKELQMELLEVPSSFYNYEVMTDNGKRYPANRNIKHYRGIVKDDPNSIVAITFFENEIMGLIVTDEGNFNLSFDKQLNKHLFYNDKNMKQRFDFECATSGIHSTAYNPEILFRESKSGSRSGSKCVYLFFETEYDIYQAKGSLLSVESFVAGVYNQVATLYQNEDIETQISEILIWTSTDPYTSNTTSSLLSQFQSNRTDINGDLGQLLTFRSIGGGIAAGFNGICNSNTAQRLSVVMLNNNYSIVPNYSWSVYVVTHEFGHLFGSRHTHACVWNGNNTAIDGCAETEGDCSLPDIPSGGGTLMSYCHLQSVGINFNLGFGNQPGNIIRNSVENGDCLCECINAAISGPTVICSSSGSSYSIQGLDTGDTIAWNQNSNITRVSTQGSNPCTFEANGYGYGWIEATINNGCRTITLPRKNVTSDMPGISPLHDPNCSYCQVSYGNVGTTYMIAALTDNTSTYAYDYYWEIYPPEGSGWDEGYADYGKQIYYSPPVEGTYIVKLRQYWDCGWSDFSVEEFEFYGGYGLLFTPNPASGETLLTIESKVKEKTFDSDIEWNMEIYSETQLLITKQTGLRGKSAKIRTAGWKEGVYLVRVKYKDEVLTGKLVVKK